MLPRLLALYKKYGSFAAGWPVIPNHFWSMGAVVEITKKGSPTDPNSRRSNQGIGLVATGGVQR
jgi:hypothetical protein